MSLLRELNTPAPTVATTYMGINNAIKQGISISNLIECAKQHWANALLVITALFILLWLFRRTKYSIAYSKETVEQLIESKKYIPEIYFEPGTIAESIRYFIFGKRWKGKLRRRYNALFVGRAKTTFDSSGFVLFLHPFCFFKRIYNVINNTKKWFVNYNEKLNSKTERIKFRSTEESRNLEPLIIGCRSYVEELNALALDVELAKTNYCHLTGDAGSGKTNIACSIAQAAWKSRNFCLFLNSRSIYENFNTHLVKELHVPKALHNCWMRIVDLLCFITRKNFCIIIDAINERDDLEFGNYLCEFVEKALSLKKSKVLLTCRNEYYEARIRDLLGRLSAKHKPIRLNINDTSNHLPSKELIFPAYISHFMFKGTLTEEVKNKLIHNLLLLRIFFEVYGNSSATITTINRYELYQNYIDSFKEQLNIDLAATLEIIADKMITTEQYDMINVSSFSLEEQKQIETIIHSGGLLLLNKVIHNPNSIIQAQINNVAFVYDELRDYCLARKLLLKNANDANNVIAFFTKELSAASEGMFKYCYEHYKTFDPENAKRLLQMCTENNRTNNSELLFHFIFGSGTPVSEQEILLLVSHIGKTSDHRLTKEAYMFLLDNERNPNITRSFINHALSYIPAKEALDSLCTIFNDDYVLCKGFHPELENLLVQRIQKEALLTQEYPLDYKRLTCLTNWACLNKDSLYETLLPSSTHTLREIILSGQSKCSENSGKLICDGVDAEPQKTNNLMLDWYWADIQNQATYIDKNNKDGFAYYELSKFYFKRSGFKWIFMLLNCTKTQSYFGQILSCIFEEIQVSSYNMHIDYLLHYRQELTNYNEYLRQRHKLSPEQYPNYQDYTWRCKEFNNGINHGIVTLFSLSQLRERIEKYFGGTL